MMNPETPTTPTPEKAPPDFADVPPTPEETAALDALRVASDEAKQTQIQAKIDEMKKAADSLQYRKEDGKPQDIMPDKLEALPKLPGEFTSLPEDVQAWLKAQLEELGPEKILHHLAIQLVTNQRLADRIRAIDALVHKGSRRERRARAKIIAKKGIDLMSGV